MWWPAVLAIVIYCTYLIGVFVGVHLARHEHRGIYEPPSHVSIRQRKIFDYDKDA